MKPQDILEAIGEHIGGTEIVYGPVHTRLRKKVPAAWRLWDDAEQKWAIFVLAGNTLSEVDAKSIRQARPNKLRLLLIVQKYEELAALAPIYREVTPYVMYPIAGKMTLIPPPAFPGNPPIPVTSLSRVPIELLDSAGKLQGLPSPLKTTVQNLARTYADMVKANKCTDETEEKALLSFARAVLTQMGLDPSHIKSTAMIRTLERDQLGARRDHFYHSFQNYFLGLAAIAELRGEFLSFRALAKVNWDIEPADVWFLTALWHDVGYAAQKFDNVFNAAFGEDDEENQGIKVEAIHRLLDRPAAQKGMRAMASLMSRLLKPQNAKSGWLEPSSNAKLGEHADGLKRAIHQNILKSHGALSAIRLYCDYTDDIDNMEPDRQALLKQTVLLACCSMPFHDFWFRSNVRDECEHCCLPVEALPFAALLAFVDSIQDDRRNLEAVREAVLILEKLLITPPNRVGAEINIEALDGQQLLDKIIEGRDVLAALDQPQNALQFKYPAWIGA